MRFLQCDLINYVFGQQTCGIILWYHHFAIRPQLIDFAE
jgi:hypothetical protein